jgi:diguanylate cyclase (GGDEF)-like protein
VTSDLSAAAGLARLGETLTGRVDDVVARMFELTTVAGVRLDASVEEDFCEVGRISTRAVSQWLAGADPAIAREVGRDAWLIFAQLAAQQNAPLNEVTKRCLRWRDSVSEMMAELSADLEMPAEVLEEALRMVRRSLDVTLVKMCQSFEEERRRVSEELEEHRGELAFQATHDALTGLPNRTLILDRGEQMLARARRDPMSVAALFIDLDGFKNINDTFGHPAGDELLTLVATRVSRALRATDTLGRMGGDEFVVLTEGISLAAGPELVAERILDVLREPFTLQAAEGRAMSVTASVGIAAGDRGSAADLLRDADIAMYRAKTSGKNRYALFEAEMETLVHARLELEMDLREALNDNQYFLVYQPTLNLDDMSVTGVEALLRWQHPTRGVVGPCDFIPMLEDTGMILAVGDWVLREACRQAAVWHQQGSRITMAVNVSGRQLDSDAFVLQVSDALATYQIDPERLILEITETALMRDTDATIRHLQAIKQLGVRIAIDDFGTGYSSMAYLRQFPIDALKIDQSFVAGLGTSSEGAALIHTFVQLGKALGIETLAEGIEEPEQLSQLQEEQCDSGQGFLFAEPLDVTSIEALLHKWSPTHVR